MLEKPPRYQAYLLRCWEERGQHADRRIGWRFTLQEVGGKRRQRGFGSLQAPGFVEFRAQRNPLGSPQVRVIHVWQSLADWARFAESAAFQAHVAEVSAFTTNEKVEIWEPSPALPEPIRAGG